MRWDLAVLIIVLRRCLSAALVNLRRRQRRWQRPTFGGVSLHPFQISRSIAANHDVDQRPPRALCHRVMTCHHGKCREQQHASQLQTTCIYVYPSPGQKALLPLNKNSAALFVVDSSSACRHHPADIRHVVNTTRPSSARYGHHRPEQWCSTACHYLRRTRSRTRRPRHHAEVLPPIGIASISLPAMPSPID